jgi:hypothetical protein
MKKAIQNKTILRGVRPLLIMSLGRLKTFHCDNQTLIRVRIQVDDIQASPTFGLKLDLITIVREKNTIAYVYLIH